MCCFGSICTVTFCTDAEKNTIKLCSNLIFSLTIFQFLDCICDCISIRLSRCENRPTCSRMDSQWPCHLCLLPTRRLHHRFQWNPYWVAWSLFDHRSFSYIVQGWWQRRICTCQAILFIWHLVQPIRNRQWFKLWLLHSPYWNRMHWMSEERYQEKMNQIFQFLWMDLLINNGYRSLLIFSEQCWLVSFSFNWFNLINKCDQHRIICFCFIASCAILRLWKNLFI